MSYESDVAFLEDYRFMLDTGESHETAARRLRTNPNALDKRLRDVRRRIETVSVSSPPSTIRGTTETTPAALARCNPGSNHREGVAS